MGKIPESKSKMIQAILGCDSAYMVVFKTKEGSDIPEVWNLAHEIHALQLTVLVSAASRFSSNRMETLMLDYVRLLQKELDDEKEDSIPDSDLDDVVTPVCDRPDRGTQLEMYTSDDGIVPSGVRVGDKPSDAIDVGSTRNDSGHVDDD